MFSFKLCLAAHEAWWSSLADIVVELEDGTSKYASSAYLEYLFKGEMGLRSDEFKLNRVSPRTEPWTILAVILDEDETLQYPVVDAVGEI